VNGAVRFPFKELVLFWARGFHFFTISLFWYWIVSE
jgi:hypothetical protein